MSLAWMAGWESEGTDVMSFQKTPGGTRGARGAGSNAMTRTLMRVMTSWHKRSGDKFQGMDLLYLTTIGAKTGQKRQSTVARFPDGDNAWLVWPRPEDRLGTRPGTTTSPRTQTRSGSSLAVTRCG